MKRLVPGSVMELLKKLRLIKKNWRYVSSCELVDNDSRMEVDLSWSANVAGYKDFYLPIKPGIGHAREVIERLTSRLASDVQPVTEADATSLFEIIDR